MEAFPSHGLLGALY